MDLHQIEIFCMLIKLRSFSGAAEALHLTQPTVSGHIKNLESDLGVMLLDRLGKRVVPTEEGEILYRYGQKLLALRDHARQEIEAVSGKMGGLLKIGGSTIPGAYILPALIGAFKKEYPSLSIQLMIDDTAKVTQAVKDGDLCIGVVGARVADGHLESHTFLTDELVVAVPAGHHWAHKKIIPVEALKTEPFIQREEGSGTRRIMEEHLEKAGFSLSDLDTVAVVGSSDAVRQAVKAGLGVSILSIRALQDDVQTGRISAVRLKGLKLERSFSIILLKGKSRSLICQVFLDFLMKEKQKFS
ncbi:MAG TPA: selenium metabolism-associated LysR family transcriptional regulator [Thermodesulfovibrionales bacterium]|nr:selenium metabolism-associated LysR family transcriptional regulator [Thermodesulfovibrionales bacterium]